MQYALLLLVLSGFIVFGKEFIFLWAGSQYINAYYIAVLILIPFTIDLIQNTGLIIMQVNNTYGYRAKVYFLIAMINIFLSTILGLKYGEVGCGLATSISMFISNIIMNVYYNQRLKINILEFWKNIFLFTLPIVPLIFCGIVGKSLFNLNSWLILLCAIVFYTVVYVVLIYKFSLKNEEKKLVFHKLFHKM